MKGKPHGGILSVRAPIFWLFIKQKVERVVLSYVGLLKTWDIF